MPSLEKNFIDSLSFDAEQIATIGLISKLKGKQELFYHQVPEALKALQQHAIVESKSKTIHEVQGESSDDSGSDSCESEDILAMEELRKLIPQKALKKKGN